MHVPRLDEIEEYYEFRKQVDSLQADFREVVTHPSYALPFMQPGRVIEVLDGNRDFGWGVVVNYEKRLYPQVGPQSIRCRTRSVADPSLYSPA